jgi:hypothetical protein
MGGGMLAMTRRELRGLGKGKGKEMKEIGEKD